MLNKGLQIRKGKKLESFLGFGLLNTEIQIGKYTETEVNIGTEINIGSVYMLRYILSLDFSTERAWSSNLPIALTTS